MLLCKVPRSSSEQLRYVFDVVFQEWLGQEYEIGFHDESRIIITRDRCGGERLAIPSNLLLGQIQIKDEIESLFPEKLVCALKDEFVLNYGHFDELDLFHTVDEHKDFVLSFNLFDSIFFMLSRYEELNNPAPDTHDRFIASASTAYRYGFLDLPIVDVYVELLWLCMARLWPDIKRQKRESRVCVSCDVDTPFDPSLRSAYWLARTCFADIAKRRSLAETYKRMRRYIYNKKGDYRHDPNYTFDWYMDVCEEYGLKAAFYFIPTSVEARNGYYELTDPAIRELLVKIDRRGHEIGVHGSYQSFRDGDKLKQQKMLLDNTLLDLGIKQRARGNRQHYLRWDVSRTPDLLDEAGFEYDTTGGYADHAGFRFGTCHEFSMWSWQTKKKLNIKQRPLVVMECSVIDDGYMGLGVDTQALSYIQSINDVCASVGGNFTLLWHNSTFGSSALKGLFSDVIKC